MSIYTAADAGYINQNQYPVGTVFMFPLSRKHSDSLGHSTMTQSLNSSPVHSSSHPFTSYPRTYPLTNTLIHSLTHALIHSLTHSCTHSLTHPPLNEGPSLIHLLPYSLAVVLRHRPW